MNVGDLFLYVSKSTPLDAGYYTVELVTDYDHMGTVNAFYFSSFGNEAHTMNNNGYVELTQSQHWIQIA